MILSIHPSKIVDEKQYKTFWYLIQERQSIYEKREDGHGSPWTADPTLQKFRFPNIFREQDKTTEWIRLNWREPYAYHYNLVFAMIVARLFNYIPTLEAIGFPGNDSWVETLQSRLAALSVKGKMYGEAYMITSGGHSGSKFIYSAECLSDIYRELMPVNTSRSLEELWRSLSGLPSVGRFIAYEVIKDLRYTRYYDGTDHMRWSLPCRSAIRGISRIWSGRADVSCMDPPAYMRHLLSVSQKELGAKFNYRLEMADIERALTILDTYAHTQENGNWVPKCRFRLGGVP